MDVISGLLNTGAIRDEVGHFLPNFTMAGKFHLSISSIGKCIMWDFEVDLIESDTERSG